LKKQKAATKTYTRTGLWMRVCKKHGINYLPILQQLGEDRLGVGLIGSVSDLFDT